MFSLIYHNFFNWMVQTYPICISMCVLCCVLCVVYFVLSVCACACAYVRVRVRVRVCVCKPGHHWSDIGLLPWSVPSHYVNKCWHVVNWKLKWKYNSFHIIKWIYKYRLQYGGQVIAASTSVCELFKLVASGDLWGVLLKHWKQC